MDSLEGTSDPAGYGRGKGTLQNRLIMDTYSFSSMFRSTELVRTAHVESSQQKAVLRVVRNLAKCTRSTFRGNFRGALIGQEPVWTGGTNSGQARKRYSRFLAEMRLVQKLKSLLSAPQGIAVPLQPVAPLALRKKRPHPADKRML
jgi:hypothetical protein